MIAISYQAIFFRKELILDITNLDLQELERFTVEGIHYISRRNRDNVEDIFRFKVPTHKFTSFANIEMQKFLWELRKTPGLKTKEEVEKEFLEELKPLREELKEIQADLEITAEAIVDRFPELPDGESDPDAYKIALDELTKDIQTLQTREFGIRRRMNSIYNYTIESLIQARKIAVLTALAWEVQTDDKWEYLWGKENNANRLSKAWEEFQNDATEISSYLEAQTYLIFARIPGFFDSLPALPTGGRLT